MKKDKDDKTLISLRIPNHLEKAIIDAAEQAGPDCNKTKIIVAILEEHFGMIDSENNDILSEINKLFSFSENIFMPKRIYKQLLQKSDELIQSEIERGIISSVFIGNTSYIVMESEIDVNAITIEHIIQKKEIVALKRQLEKLTEQVKSYHPELCTPEDELPSE